MAHNGKGYNSKRAAQPQVLVNLTTADNDCSGYASLPPPTQNIDHADSSQQHSKRKRLDYLLQSAVESFSETFGVRDSSPIEHDTQDKHKKTKIKSDPSCKKPT